MMKIPLLNSAWAYVRSKARLWIEYFLIASVVAAAGFSLSTWVKGKALENTVLTLSGTVGGLSQTVLEQVATNTEQDKAISTLNDLRKTDAKAWDALQKSFASNGKADREIRQKIRELEKNNARAKALMDTAIPDDVSCVLDDTPCPAPAGNDKNQDPSSSAARPPHGTMFFTYTP